MWTSGNATSLDDNYDCMDERTIRWDRCIECAGRHYEEKSISHGDACQSKACKRGSEGTFDVGRATLQTATRSSYPKTEAHRVHIAILGGRSSLEGPISACAALTGHLGQRTQDPPNLLQGQGLQEALVFSDSALSAHMLRYRRYPAQGYTVQGGQGFVVRPGKASL
jgi:hypothetical protein